MLFSNPFHGFHHLGNDCSVFWGCSSGGELPQLRDDISSHGGLDKALEDASKLVSAVHEDSAADDVDSHHAADLGPP